MQIVPFPHPALRWKSRDVTRIDDNLRSIVEEMFDLMYESKGIGLAANQVGLPIRLFVVNVSGDPEKKDEEVVFINPTIRNRSGQAVGEEGCLSLPGLYADVSRPETITVEAFDLDGQPFRVKIDDLPARVIQHETDHLDGVLFIDRLDETELAQLVTKLNDFTSSFRKQQTAGETPSDEEINRILEEMAKTGDFGPVIG
ncbi:MAG TPA: peptide deformylase [Caulifigura sp.]|nr:peptide deformylase [Caulifigura sp.]